MIRRHNMPFGAECREDGSVRFRLWAPTANEVDLCIRVAGRSISLPLNRRDAGWFELTTDEAKSGSRYYFRINSAEQVPDPASRFQPEDVHGPSEVVNPEGFEWQDSSWHGRRWEEAVIYEVHVGAFTPHGTYSSVCERLDYLADLGITALELMPVADFPGKRNWGYDGVLPFAPDSSYGRPDDLKNLVQSAHSCGIMVLLDVVYNHFGPEGNYLKAYAPQFFTDRHHTPWGNGLNFDGPHSRAVRDFFIHNALYWLTEFHFDGLRLDAVHAIADDSKPYILTELVETVRSKVAPDHHVHLILENERNQVSFLQRARGCQTRGYTAQWNDDVHHALHVLITGENDGYYSDYSTNPITQLGRCLTEGFAYQGEISVHGGGKARGEPSVGLSPTAFVSFLQNHDQIGNRAFGERITAIADRRAVRAAMAILLLAPSPPLLFMGEEFAAETPFLFFCDFEKDLAAAVTAGRRNEFSHFAGFGDSHQREQIPDPSAEKTFVASRLNWDSIHQTSGQDWLGFYRKLIGLRAQHIVPCLRAGCPVKTDYHLHGEHGLSAQWEFRDGAKLSLGANLGSDSLSGLIPPPLPIIYSSEEVTLDALQAGELPSWSIVWCLES